MTETFMIRELEQSRPSRSLEHPRRRLFATFAGVSQDRLRAMARREPAP